MKKYTFKLLTSVLLITCTFLNVACEDIDDIHELELDRILSPTELGVRIRNNVNAEVSWNKMDHAETYALEVYAGTTAEGSPVKAVSDITTTSYTVEQLEGESTYIVQVKCVGTNIGDSKWSTTTFTTNAEQILQSVDEANDLEATQVTLRWPAGQTATSIILTPEDGSADITYTVTAADIATGAATITGLTDEMTYTAKLMNGTKTRGTVTFTTPIDIGNATLIEADDDLASIVKNAEEGAVFAIMPGTYTVATLTVSKSIALKAAKPADKPVLSTTIIRLSAGAALELNGIVLDGTDSSGDQTIVYDENGTYGALLINNCEIKNYTKGALYGNKECNIESVTITNCIYSDIECNGGDLFDFRNSITAAFTFMNNTVYNSAAARDGFRMDAGGSTKFPEVKSIINISNNTFDNVCNNSGKRLLYVRLANHEITFNKNILSNTAGYYSNQASTTIVEMEKNNYFNAPNFTSSTQSNAKNDTGSSYTSLDPQYKDAANGDFTLGNEDLSYYGIGDPRWW